MKPIHVILGYIVIAASSGFAWFESFSHATPELRSTDCGILSNKTCSPQTTTFILSGIMFFMIAFVALMCAIYVWVYSASPKESKFNWRNRHE